MDPENGASEPAESYVAFVQRQLQQLNEDLVEGQTLEAVVPLANGDRILATSFAYHNPDLIKISGTDQNGNDTCIVVHKTQLQLVLRRVSSRQEVNPQLAFQDPGQTQPKQILFDGTA